MSDYCEWPEFYDETFPKARKQYRCCECSAPVLIGETHLHWRGKWDGEMVHGRQHMLCRELCMFIRDNYQSGECLSFGEMYEGWDGLCWDGSRSDKDRQARKMMAQIKWRERAWRKKVVDVRINESGSENSKTDHASL